jgi:LysR family glycine cleavage system transcriptional activator
MRVPRQALLDGLRAFSVAARALSFKAAAEALFVTPSAISHRIRDLERHLGQHVFVRKTRAVELTDAGRALLGEVEPLLAGLDAAIERAARRPRRRVLQVAVPPFLATELLIPALRSFYGMQPRIDLVISTNASRLSEHRAGADVSIVIAAAPPADLVATRLFSPRFVAATARPVALVARELGARVFEKQRRIVYRDRAELWTRWFATTGIAAARGASTLEVDTLPAAIAAAELGVGIALVPTFVVDRGIRRARLVRIADSEIESADAYFVVYRPEDRGRPELRAFLSWALSELRR